MNAFRNFLFQIHLWVGLCLGIFFILLGLSGSLLVYPQLLQSASEPPPAAATKGTPLPLEQIIDAARRASPRAEGAAATVVLPTLPGGAIGVQFNAQRGGAGEGRGAGGRGGRRGNRAGGNGAGRDGAQQARGEGGAGRGPQGGRGGPAALTLYLDPVSGQVLATRTQTPPALVGIAHQMHEAMLMGGAGRTLVAWLGVGMLFLGMSGLYLWWPKTGQWKNAFIVRRKARGVRLWREIHGMTGIWFWLVFLFVTLTSIPLGFPSVLAMVTGQAVGPQGPPQQPAIDVPADGTRLPLDRLLAEAAKTTGAHPVSLTVPAQADRPVTIGFEAGERGGRAFNPYTGEAIAAQGPSAQGLNRGTIEQWHGGSGFGPVWKFLVFLTGFLPLIFVSTGALMWFKKRQNRNETRRAAAA
jgi:uncharacterized iron-regulated membrane protein